MIYFPTCVPGDAVKLMDEVGITQIQTRALLHTKGVQSVSSNCTAGCRKEKSLVFVLYYIF